MNSSTGRSISESLTIRQAQPGDREGICALFKTVYGRRKRIEEYRWLYERNPSGRHRTWVAVDGETGQVVGARPVFPWRMKIGTEEILASQAGDAMTHPAWRGQGIFTALVMAAWSGLRDEGIPFSYSFSNPGSLSVYNKVKISDEETVGTHEIGTLCRWVRPLRWEALLARRTGNAWLSAPLGRLADIATDVVTHLGHAGDPAGLTVRAIDRFDERFNELWATAARPFPVIGVRDAAFLNWRYIDTPHRRHTALAVERGDTLLGYVVVELLPGSDGIIEGHISDFLVVPEPAAFDALMDGVLRWLRKATAAQGVFTALEGHPYDGQLRRWGFVQRPSQRPFAVHIHVPTDRENLPLDPHQWFLTLGDREIESAG